MITFIDKPYLTDKISVKLEKVKKDILEEKLLSLACIITFSKNDSDVFDIIPINNLKLSKKYTEDILVIGIAENKKAAIKLCASLAEEYLKRSLDISMREYFEKLTLN